jgi:hypothetical protein
LFHGEFTVSYHEMGYVTRSGTFTSEQGTSDCRNGTHTGTEAVVQSDRGPIPYFSAFLLKTLICGCYFHFESTYNKSVQMTDINVIITLQGIK